jgi:hypothetical protein
MCTPVAAATAATLGHWVDIPPPDATGVDERCEVGVLTGADEVVVPAGGTGGAVVTDCVGAATPPPVPDPLVDELHPVTEIATVTVTAISAPSPHPRRPISRCGAPVPAGLSGWRAAMVAVLSTVEATLDPDARRPHP